MTNVIPLARRRAAATTPTTGTTPDPIQAYADAHNALAMALQTADTGKTFILPAGSRAAAQAHVCRTVARRAERAVVALGDVDAVREAPRQYLNRLSDLMFVLARVLNRMHGGDDVYWKSERLQRGAAE